MRGKCGSISTLTYCHRGRKMKECKKCKEVKPLDDFHNHPRTKDRRHERGAWFKRVLWDISQIGYDAEWHCIPASELGAHHHRDRIWIVAYPNSAQCQRRSLSFGVHKENANTVGASGWQAEPSLGRVLMGFPLNHTDLNA